MYHLRLQLLIFPLNILKVPNGNLLGTLRIFGSELDTRGLVKNWQLILPQIDMFVWLHLVYFSYWGNITFKKILPSYMCIVL